MKRRSPLRRAGTLDPPPAAARAERARAEAGVPVADRVEQGLVGWRRERPDIDSSGKEIVGRIVHLHSIALRAVDAALRRHRLKYPAYGLLATLRASGAPYRLTAGQLMRTLLYSSGGLSNLLARLEREGLVSRSPGTEDRREVVVALTARGVALADRAMVDHAAAERALLSGLTDGERRTLAAGLRRLILLNDGGSG